jgi:hypothetical protein
LRLYWRIHHVEMNGAIARTECWGVNEQPANLLKMDLKISGDRTPTQWRA